MALYDAMRTLLVDEGPLETLYLYRLPAEQTAEVDVASTSRCPGRGCSGTWGRLRCRAVLRA